MSQRELDTIKAENHLLKEQELSERARAQEIERQISELYSLLSPIKERIRSLEGRRLTNEKEIVSREGGVKQVSKRSERAQASQDRETASLVAKASKLLARLSQEELDELRQNQETAEPSEEN